MDNKIFDNICMFSYYNICMIIFVCFHINITLYYIKNIINYLIFFTYIHFIIHILINNKNKFFFNLKKYNKIFYILLCQLIQLIYYNHFKIYLIKNKFLIKIIG